MTGFDHDKRIRWRDRVAKIGAPILISIAILSLMVNTVLGIVLYNVYTGGHAETAQSNKQTQALINKSIKVSNNHHNSTSQQNAALGKALNTIIGLQTQLQTETADLEAAEAKLAIVGPFLGQWDAWAEGIIAPLCALSANASNCPAPPPIPAELSP